MTAESEAVMVSPEQCATAPRVGTKGAMLAPAPKANPTRLVLLAVLALAAATGAMFGVVVFGNEFTKDVHPNGGSHMNSVTLVDAQDRAIATADVESYVSLLDLPLLGTAELNKVDGITFSTHKGVEHRKVMGYTVSKETASAGGSAVETPRLSLKSEPGVTIEVSVRDAKAWIQDRSGAVAARTEIEVAPQRRLGDGGSCLANGACLYSSDELLRLDAETRRLSEGGFFARADVAAYQVDLMGEDVMQYVNSESFSFFEGVYEDDSGSKMLLRARRDGTGTSMYLKNLTDDTARLMTKNGTFVTEGDKVAQCKGPEDSSHEGTVSMLRNLDFDSFQSGSIGIDFNEANVVHRGSDIEGFIPMIELTPDSCENHYKKLMNYHESSHVENGVVIDDDGINDDKPGLGHQGRKLAARQWANHVLKFSTRAKRVESHEAEMMQYMTDMNNERNQEIIRDVERRRLEIEINDDLTSKFDYSKQTSTFGQGSGGGGSFITHFDLWLATRIADPTFTASGTHDWVDASAAAQASMGMNADNDKFSSLTGVTLINDDTADWDARGYQFNPSTIIELAGSHGVSTTFISWVGLDYAPAKYMPRYLLEDVNEITDLATQNSLQNAAVNNGATLSSWYSGDRSGTAPYRWNLDETMVGYMNGYGEYKDEFMDFMQQNIAKGFYHALLDGTCTGGYDQEKSAGITELIQLIADVTNAAVEDELTGFKQQFKRDFIMFNSGFNHAEQSLNFCTALKNKATTNSGNGLLSWIDEYNQVAQHGSLCLSENSDGTWNKVDSAGNPVRCIECKTGNGVQDSKRSAAGYSSDWDNCRDNVMTIFAEMCDQIVTAPENEPAKLSVGYSSTMSGGFFELPMMNTWASYLRKKVNAESGAEAYMVAEHIAAFQGTKTSDVSMWEYNTDRAPIFTYMGKNPAIIPNGNRRYMMGLVDCLNWFIDDYTYLNPTGTTILAHTTFITGHSLGAAAATLFGSSRANWPNGNHYPRVVTFGGPPTAYKGTVPKMKGTSTTGAMGSAIQCIPMEFSKGASSSYSSAQARNAHALHGPNPLAADHGYAYSTFCSEHSNGEDLYMTADKFRANYANIARSYCENAPPQSVRFIHKFDSAGSLALPMGQFGHAMAYQVVLMDKKVSDCNPSSIGCSPSSNKLKSGNNYNDLMQNDYYQTGLDTTNPFLAPSYLCTKFTNYPISWATTCINQFSSLVSLTLNPCAQIATYDRMTEMWSSAGAAWSQNFKRDCDEGDKNNAGDENCVSMNTATMTMTGTEGMYCILHGEHMEYQCIDIGTAATSFYKKIETTGNCLKDWAATTENYMEASAIDMWMSGGLLYSVFIHSGYGFYPLCLKHDGNGGLDPGFFPDTATQNLFEAFKAPAVSSSLEADINAHCSRWAYANFWMDCYTVSMQHGKACCRDDLETCYTGEPDCPGDGKRFNHHADSPWRCDVNLANCGI